MQKDTRKEVERTKTRYVRLYLLISAGALLKLPSDLSSNTR